MTAGTLETSRHAASRFRKAFAIGSLTLTLALLCGLATGAQATTTERNEWYWSSLVNLHIDNHGGLVGKGKTADEIAAELRKLPVDIVQVSAYGADGAKATYPSKLLPRDDLDGWDTLGVWKAAAEKAGKRFHVYINTRGLTVTATHPDWVQRDAAGKGKGRNNGLDTCARPSADGSGYLESLLLPLLEEIMSQYRPDGIWVDGDHARTRTCYCKHCQAAWHALTGKAEPPTDSTDPDWPRWLALEQERYDEYRRKMSEVIHRVHPQAFYTSNHSWKKATHIFEKDDPRSAPDFADTISADLSHGQALWITRSKALFLSAEQNTPWDIMHLIYRPQEISRQRVLQQGAVTIAHGGSWFLWSPGGDPLAPDAFTRALECAQFVRDRAPALGRTTSINPIAVLLSETAWQEERVGGKAGFAGLAEAQHWAMMLEDACSGVDLLNETDLARPLGQYRLIVVPNQRAVSPATEKRLQQFASAGGKIVYTEDVPVPDYDGVAARLMESQGLGPSVRLSGPGKQEHFIFNFRKKGSQTIVHLVNVGSSVHGKRRYDELTQLIDDLPPVPEVTIRLASSKPSSVQVVPATTTVAHTWDQGILTVTLKNVDVHAALIMDAVPALLPVGVPLDERHPLSHYVRTEGLDEDFEKASRGQEVKLIGPYSFRSRGDTKIEITDETASSGKHALKFTDAPCDPAFMPMLCIQPKINLPAVFSCDLKLEPGATVWLDFREQENRREFPAGPSLTFHAKTGKITAGRKEIGEFPIGEWFSVEIALPANGDAFYSLRVGQEKPHAKLPYDNPRFAKCGWIGIIGIGNESSCFYVDNVKLQR